jgi:hypothetical protein
MGLARVHILLYRLSCEYIFSFESIVKNRVGVLDVQLSEDGCEDAENEPDHAERDNQWDCGDDECEQWCEQFRNGSKYAPPYSS